MAILALCWRPCISPMRVRGLDIDKALLAGVGLQHNAAIRKRKPLGRWRYNHDFPNSTMAP